MTPPEPHDSYTTAQVLVLERLARMETKIDLYNETRKTADEALETSRRLARDVDEIKDDRKWLSRVIVGLVFAALINLAINAMQGL